MRKPTKAAKPRKAARNPQSRKAAKPALLAGGNPQIAKADGDAPVQAYIAAMPGWKRGVGRRLDALVARVVPGVRKAVEMEFALLWRRRAGVVHQLSLLHEVREGDVLPRRVAASSPARRVQTQERALPRHPRGRARRSSARRLGEASERIAGRKNVSGPAETRGSRRGTVTRARAFIPLVIIRGGTRTSASPA